MSSAAERGAWPSPFWRSRRVLVTGHTGFKGAWLCRALLRAGADVTGYSLPAPSDPSLFALVRLEADVRHRHGDVRDLDALRRCMTELRPEIVFHLAAQSLVLESYRDPVGTFSTNVMGTLNVLEAVRTSDETRACVVVTSDKCYEPGDSPRPHPEGDPLGGVDPYSASKACAEIVTAGYRRSLMGDSPARIASVRAGNVIGGGDWSADRLVPDVVRALTTRAQLVLRRPDAVRPWQHVLDPLGGYLTLAERLVEDGTLEGGWNFGPDPEDAWPVRRVVEEFVAVWDEPVADGVVVAPSGVPETGYLAVDSAKARNRLGWRPRWGVGDAIARTAAWYAAWYGGAEASELVDADLDEYASREAARSATGAGGSGSA